MLSISPDDFDGLQSDLQRRADTLESLIANLTSSWQQVVWRGPSRDHFEPDNQQMFSELNQMLSAMQSAAKDAGNVAQDFRNALKDLDSIFKHVTGWLTSGAKMVEKGMTETADSFSYTVFGVAQAGLPSPDSPDWYNLYDVALQHGMPSL